MNKPKFWLCRGEAKGLWLLILGAFGCGSPVPLPAAETDSQPTSVDGGSDGDADASALADSANADSSADVNASVESDAADAADAVDSAKYPDCALPQTAGCPCSAAELGTNCCFKVTDGLTCSKQYVDGTLKWQSFADCCRDTKPECEKHNPKPTPPWCNGKVQ